MLRTTLLQVLTSVFLLILGSVVGIYTERYKVASNERVRTLESEIRIETQVMTPPSVVKGVVAITVDGRPVEGISSVLVRIYNRTDRDFEQIPIYIEIVPTKTTSPPITIVGSEVYGAKGLKDGIALIDQVSPSNAPGARRLGYTIRNANRSDEPILVARFILVGREVSRANVSIDKKGLDLVEYRIHNDDGLALDRYLPFAFLFLGIGAFVWLAPKAEAWTVRREIARLREVLPTALTTYGLDGPQVATAMDQIIELVLVTKRQAAPFGLRWLTPTPSEIKGRSEGATTPSETT